MTLIAVDICAVDGGITVVDATLALIIVVVAAVTVLAGTTVVVTALDGMLVVGSGCPLVY